MVLLSCLLYIRRVSSAPYSPRISLNFRLAIEYNGRLITTPEGIFFYSPNCKRDVAIPLIDQAYILNPFRAHLSAFKRPRIWTKDFGWCAFVPLYASFEGATFECLRYLDQYSIVEESAEGQPSLRISLTATTRLWPIQWPPRRGRCGCGMNEFLSI